MIPVAAYVPALTQAAVLVLGLSAGLLAGLLHFTTLHRVVRLFATGAALRAALLQAGRLALAGAVLFGLAQLGAAALIAGLGGILAARSLTLRRLGGTE